ncbi:dihydrofolate reductase [Gallibacterium salpingitidis]|uniref:Dihydromonapterin reductase n=1 Tax=Gallibacterium salpingitidis TaxID=505341 RepID=A0AB36E6Q0_9PAST|nr:dihydromonapterin reductase [Gallibacterium salpingitidis]OBX08038.1 dihydrofolate reductase [Gallibacterium salpingitidis]OBX11260.1 dihydrofolate reductase [Gallibacterium salpingitidis]WKT00662.1 dihydromonapterin reductase [Gallibacterium salpingitidis]
MKNVIIITGAGRRIGLALAQSLAMRGENLLISYRYPYPQLEQLPANVSKIQADFSTLSGIEHFIQQVKKQCSSIRAIIHNASAWQAETSEADLLQDQQLFQSLMRIHAELPYLLNRQFADLLIQYAHQQQRPADIIHLTDFVALKGSQKHLAYAASKAALENLTLSFAAKYAPLIKVNSIAPALIAFNDNDPPEYQQQSKQKSVMQKVGGYAEIIKAVDYLLSSEYVTGETLQVTGGRHLK